MEEYPECYAPYTLASGDLSQLDQYLKDIYGISNDTFLNLWLANGTYNGTSILSIIDDYNSCIDIGDMACSNFNNIESLKSKNGFNQNNVLKGKNAVVSIDIVFQDASEPVEIGDAVTTYYSHPAFWWDDNDDGNVDSNEILSGIWVGKFETTGNNNMPTVLPNMESKKIEHISVPIMYSSIIANGSLDDNHINFIADENNIYGLNTNINSTNSHAIKNSEWGAVAYLSHSEYGINTNIRKNNNSSCMTGCGALSADTSSTSSCQIKYGSGIANYPQSTTGNITGIFDMSGGCREYVMGIKDYNEIPQYLSSIPENKYFDVYLDNKFTGNNGFGMGLCTLEECGGHALNEIVAWYDADMKFVSSSPEWIIRGQNSSIFDMTTAYQHVFTDSSYRTVIITGVNK